METIDVQIITTSRCNLRCKDELLTGNLSPICDRCERKEIVELGQFSEVIEQLK